MNTIPTLKAYVFGFILSLVLTLSAYLVVVSHMFTVQAVIGVVITLAFFQLIAQLIFFLHLTHDEKPRWNVFIFFTTIIGIVILVLGSIWIMNHLNYSMTPTDMNTSIMQNEGMHM